jgi:Mg2+-importing ATPase
VFDGGVSEAVISTKLALTTVGVVVVALVLPFTPAAAPLGLVPLPGSFFLFLAAIVGAYFVCVELAKRWLLRRYAPGAVSG